MTHLDVDELEFFVSSYTSSLFYNRETEYIVKLLEEVIERLKEPCKRSTQWTDGGDILYGTLVIMYGDYGTSPRSGWIDEDIKKDIIKVFEDELKEYQGILSRENDNG